MTERILLFGMVLATALFPTLCPVEAAAAGPGPRVTVFNQDLGMVAETRALDLEKGTREAAFPGVAARIEPDSVQFLSLTDPEGVRLLEQRFEFDLSSTESLLGRYVGSPVLVTGREGETLQGSLMDLQGGDVALRLTEGAVRLIRSGAVETFLLPAGAPAPVETPTLFFLLDTVRPGKHDVRVHYLTRGMAWQADYVAKVDRDRGRMELAGWASVENRSGASYQEAQVQLVAGTVHQASAPPSFENRGARPMAVADMAAKAAPGFQETPFAEYRFYTLARPATLGDRQVTRLPLFPAAKADVRTEYSYDGARDEERVRVNLVVKNEKGQGLGIPLPAGTVRVYQDAPNGSLVFTGEDRIDHVPEGEKVELFVGNAFDIQGERTVLETKPISKRSRQETVEIELRNRKREAVTVKVIERFHGNWNFQGDTPPVLKKQADRAEFEVKVPAQGEKKFQYTVLYAW